MPESTLLPERIFGLSADDGRRTVRPGEVVSFRFRAKNAGAVATPAASLELVLPPGWSALDPLDAVIPPVAPGDAHTVAFRARPDVADSTTACSPIQAALRVATLLLGSNVVPMRVYGRPRLNGPASGIRIEPGPGDTLSVNATVVNEGDAPARDVHVVLPAPPGFAAGKAPDQAASADLAVGEMLSIAYDATPIGAVAAEVRIDDAFISYDGGSVALRTVRPARLLPKLGPPKIACRRRAGRLDLLVRVENAGWVPARDVGLALALSAGWRIVRGTIHTGGAPSTLRRNAALENGVAVALPLVPARGTVEVSLVATASRERLEGELTVECGDDVVVCAIPLGAERSLHLEALPESAFAESGAVIAVTIDAYNTGETRERVTLLLAGEPCWSADLRAGAAAACIAQFRVPKNRNGGDNLTIDAEARGEDGRSLATTQFELRLLDRPRVATDDLGSEAGDDRARPVVVAVQCTAPDSARSGERLEVRVACTPA